MTAYDDLTKVLSGYQQANQTYEKIAHFPEARNATAQFALEELGEAHVKSITFDNGTENTKHVELKNDYNLQTYFCDPYCSWQKGKVENLNGLIRQYLPRSINMKEITDEQICDIQEKLNNRPRKSLGYFTPNHAFQILAQGGRLRT